MARITPTLVIHAPKNEELTRRFITEFLVTLILKKACETPTNHP